MTTPLPAAADIIDLLAGIAPGSPLAAVRDQRAQVLAQCLRSARHGVRDGRDAGPGVQHADSLGTLAREDKSDFHV